MVRWILQLLVMLFVAQPLLCFAVDPILIDKTKSLKRCDNCDFPRADLTGVDFKGRAIAAG